MAFWQGVKGHLISSSDPNGSGMFRGAPPTSVHCTGLCLLSTQIQTLPGGSWEVATGTSRLPQDGWLPGQRGPKPSGACQSQSLGFTTRHMCRSLLSPESPFLSPLLQLWVCGGVQAFCSEPQHLPKALISELVLCACVFLCVQMRVGAALHVHACTLYGG